MKVTKKVTACGIIPIFINQKGEKQFLLIKAHHGGINFPKGHMEIGESFLETAQRELLEETGLTCKNIDSNNMITEHYTVVRPEKMIEKTVHYFIGYVETQNVAIQPAEIKDYFWLDAKKCLEKMNHKESKDVLKKALNILNKK